MKNGHLFKNLLLRGLMAQVAVVGRLTSLLNRRPPRREEVTLPTVDGLELFTWVYVP